MIFCEVRGSAPENDFYSHDATREIQNVRLTCQRFCWASSHLLYTTAIIQIQPEFLERVEWLSRHPTLRMGVERVVTMLHYYQPSLAESLQTFDTQ